MGTLFRKAEGAAVHWLFGMNWRHTLFPTTPLLEIFVRGTVMYVGLFLFLRFILKREYGAMGITDILVVVLIADAAQNGMSDNYHSVSDGLVLVLVIIGWAYALDRLAFRFPAIARIVKPGPLPLVEDGRMQWRNMRHELITQDELWAHLRRQGVDDIQQVKLAVMESDGTISVIQAEGRKASPSPQPARRRVM
jgi:uncharacterized membrane protein YcaP (DUF421 family)